MYKLGKWKYVNHLGETFASDGIKVFIRDNSVLNYKWSYETSGSRITSLRRDSQEKVLPIVINGDTNKEGIELRNKLYEVVDKDVLAQEPGRLYFGCWYLTGYVVESQKSQFMQTERIMLSDLTFVSIDSVWRKENLIQLLPQEFDEPRKQREPITTGRPGSATLPMDQNIIFHEYPYDFMLKGTRHTIYPQYDYKYDYIRTKGRYAIVNDSFVASNFIMTIYGFVNHPIINIGNHQYGVDALIYEGERLVIDSVAETITKIGRLGEKTNLFNSRDKIFSVFEPIPAGRSPLVWPGTYGVDLIIFEERSEPKWEECF